MEQTYTLLHSLTESEKDLLRHNLSYGYTNNKGRKNKLLQLANFLLSRKKKPTYQECLEGVYGKGEEGKKIINLRKRLFTRILDLFIFDSELGRNEKLDNQDLEWIMAKKKLAQFYLLFYSGREPKLSLEILEDAIEISKRQEHYLVLIECLRFKKWIIGLKNGMKYFLSLQDEIIHYEFCSKTVSKAVDLFYTIGISGDYSSAINKKERISLLKKRIKEINKDNLIAGSKVAEYYIKVLEIDSLMNSNDYLKAKEKCNRLTEFIQSNAAVFRKQRLASVFCNLSRCELFLGDFEAATDHANTAIKFYEHGTRNYYIAHEQKLYALFYRGKLKQALEIASELIDSSKDELGDFRNAKFNCFVASIHFTNQDYEKALSILDSIKELSKDKCGWDIAIRFLRIMCNIELSRTDPTISLIEALRKHVSNYSAKTELLQRHKLIIRLFKEFEKQGFVFKKSNPSITLLLNLLKEKNQSQSWELLGPELIPIHKWAEGKFT